MAIRTDPQRIVTEPQDLSVPARRGSMAPWPDGEASSRWPDASPVRSGKPSLSGRPHPDRPDRQVGPAGRVIVLGLVCFLLWGLLAAPSLRRSAESSPLGVRRTAALTVLRPLSRMSRLLGLDRIASGMDRVLGRSHEHKAIPPLAETLGRRPILSPSPSVQTPFQTAHRSPDPGVRPAARPLPSPSEVPVIAGPLLHRPTKGRPLRVLAVGDSIGEDLAIGLARALSGRKPFVLKTDARQATGLARPDYFDWAYQVAVDMRELRPDVVVAAFGANDGQSFLSQGQGVRVGSREWKRIYRQRAGRIMAEVAASGLPIIWVGMPPMASPRISQNMSMIDGLVRAEAAGRGGVVYLDSWSLFAGPGGGYSAYLPSPSGQQELVRTSDGIHLTAAGLDRLAGAVMRVMAGLWKAPAR